LPIALIISLFSNHIIQTIFGSEYQAAGPMLKVLIWAFFISALNVSNSRMLIVANHQQKMALFALFSTVGNVTLSLLLVPRFGGMGTAWARILAMPLYSIPALIYVQRHITKINWYDFWRFDFKFSGEQQ
jgi:O-antigen/teichoic acid export membrane protein